MTHVKTLGTIGLVIVGAVAGFFLALSLQGTESDLRCKGIEATFVGTDEADTFTGGPKGDVVVAGEGDDRISGLGGSDILCGGPGDDRLNGGGGRDAVSGDEGDDSLTGGDGTDVGIGGPGVDTCRTESAACERP